MSAPPAGRIAVAVATAAACVASLFALGTGAARIATPRVSDLGEREASMLAAARLHPGPPPLPELGTASFCRECHPPVPHPGVGVREALLNAHAAWMDCLACHGAGGEGGFLPPRWVTGPGKGVYAAVLPPERSGREELVGLRARVTARRPCFERGGGCQGCHRPGGMESWARPDAVPQRTEQLERLESVFTLAPGEKWYFPQFQ